MSLLHCFLRFMICRGALQKSICGYYESSKMLGGSKLTCYHHMQVSLLSAGSEPKSDRPGFYLVSLVLLGCVAGTSHADDCFYDLLHPLLLQKQETHCTGSALANNATSHCSEDFSRSSRYNPAGCDVFQTTSHC